MDMNVLDITLFTLIAIACLGLICATIRVDSAYQTWDKAFKKLQQEKLKHGMGTEYWRIWHEEVCPAYKKLTEETPKALRHPKTEDILEDMGKPVAERKHF
jgi:hypothetical protein